MRCIHYSLLIALLSATAASGQPFPLQDATWQGIESTISGLDTFQQVLCGDTLINGRMYAPVLGIDGQTGDTTYLAAVRSDGLRSFFVRPSEVQDHLLYDFSLEAGAEVTLEYVPFQGSTTLKVANVATVGTGADTRTVINFVPNGGLQETWIGGVGSLSGPLNRGILNPSVYSELHCFRLADTLSYASVNTAQCSFSFDCPTVVSTKSQGQRNSISVYPTLPVEGQVWVENRSGKPHSATLYSALGQPLRSWHQLGYGRHELQLPELSPGLFLLSLRELNKKTAPQYFKLIIPK